MLRWRTAGAVGGQLKPGPGREARSLARMRFGLDIRVEGVRIGTGLGGRIGGAQTTKLLMTLGRGGQRSQTCASAARRAGIVGTVETKWSSPRGPKRQGGTARGKRGGKRSGVTGRCGGALGTTMSVRLTLLMLWKGVAVAVHVGAGRQMGAKLLGRWHVGAGQPGKRGWPAQKKEGWRQRGAFVARRACQKGQPGGGGSHNGLQWGRRNEAQGGLRGVS